MTASLFLHTSRTSKTTSSLRQATALVLCVAAGAITTAAHAKLSATGGTEVGFVAVGPGGMKIVGTTSELHVTDEADKLTISVPLSHLTTGIGLRDKHMRETYLEVQKYPNAVLETSRAALRLPAQGETQGEAQGLMTIHGQTKPVNFHYAARREVGNFKVTGALRVNMKDFGIQTPNYMGITVKPETDISVRFDAEDR